MKHGVLLSVTSLLSILFMSLHLADDIVRGFEPATLSNLTDTGELIYFGSYPGLG